MTENLARRSARALAGRDGLVQTRPSRGGVILALALGLPLAMGDMSAGASILLQNSAPSDASYEENAHSGIVMTIVDATGKPVAGKLVVLHKINRADDYFNLAINNSYATTDVSGKTPALFLSPDKYIILVADFRGFQEEVEIKPHALLTLR